MLRTAVITCLSLLLLTVSSSNLRTLNAIDTESVVNYLTSQTKWLRDRAEFNINQLRDSQGRIGPITMPSLLLGDIVGEMDLPPTAPAPSTLEVKVRLAVVDPTQGSEESEENKAPQTTIELVIPVDISADMGLMIDAAGMHATSGFFEGKAIPLTEISSGAQDAPRAMETKEEAMAVVSRLLYHVNQWRQEKCGTNQPQLTESNCNLIKHSAIFGWVVDAGPGHETQVTAVDCGANAVFVGSIDIPRGGTGVEDGFFGGTIPGPCKIGIESPPAHVLPARKTDTKATMFLDLNIVDDDPRLTSVRDRLQGDREAFMSKTRFSQVPMLSELKKFDATKYKEKLPKEFDPRKDDIINFPGSAKGCFQAPNRVRNQRDCMSCWAFASATVYTDRKCLSNLRQISDPTILPPPTLYSPASALACRKPPTCILGKKICVVLFVFVLFVCCSLLMLFFSHVISPFLFFSFHAGGFTNFVSMISSGIASETCFPYKLKTDGAAKYKVETGEMYTDSDVVPSCPRVEAGGDGMCPGNVEEKYNAETVDDFGVYRIHGGKKF